MERFLLVHVPGALLGSLIVVVAIAASLVGLFLVRRRVALATLERHNDVAGFIIAVIGGLYAVLLAFVVVSVWGQFEAARADASHEADLVDLLYANAAFFPGHVAYIRTDLRAYAQSVVDNEWQEVSAHQLDSPQTDRQLRVLLNDFRTIHPETTEESAFFSESVKQLYTWQATGDFEWMLVATGCRWSCGPS